MEKIKLTVEVSVKAPIEKVWEYWTTPEHIKEWNNASPDWHTPYAENDLKVGGKFLYRMEARDGSFGFDFSGVYVEMKLYEKISYTLGDDRKVNISFVDQDNATKVIETFEAEDTNSIDLQKSGWQSIINNFKEYVEETKG